MVHIVKRNATLPIRLLFIKGVFLQDSCEDRPLDSNYTNLICKEG